MTPEQRLDRLERLAKLFATEGRRLRSEFHQRIEILMNAQMLNEARFERNEERFARLAESQIHTDQRLDALIDIVREGRRGDSSPNV